MRLILSNQMVKELKKELNGIADVKLVKIYPETYKACVDYDLWKHEDDFSATTNTLRAAQVIYPAESYALPAYITSQDLKRCFAMSDRTWNGFFNEIRNEYAI